MRVKSASDIKRKHLELKPDSHFFKRQTMKFFGDTIKNFGVWNDKVNNRVIMYRKKPVPHSKLHRWVFNTITGDLRSLGENDE